MKLSIWTFDHLTALGWPKPHMPGSQGRQTRCYLESEPDTEASDSTFSRIYAQLHVEAGILAQILNEWPNHRPTLSIMCSELMV